MRANIPSHPIPSHPSPHLSEEDGEAGNHVHRHGTPAEHVAPKQHHSRLPLPHPVQLGHSAWGGGKGGDRREGGQVAHTIPADKTKDSGRMGKWGNGEKAKWQDGKIAKCQKVKWLMA